MKGDYSQVRLILLDTVAKSLNAPLGALILTLLCAACLSCSQTESDRMITAIEILSEQLHSDSCLSINGRMQIRNVITSKYDSLILLDSNSPNIAQWRIEIGLLNEENNRDKRFIRYIDLIGQVQDYRGTGAMGYPLQMSIARFDAIRAAELYKDSILMGEFLFPLIDSIESYANILEQEQRWAEHIALRDLYLREMIEYGLEVQDACLNSKDHKINPKVIAREKLIEEYILLLRQNCSGNAAWDALIHIDNAFGRYSFILGQISKGINIPFNDWQYFDRRADEELAQFEVYYDSILGSEGY